MQKVYKVCSNPLQSLKFSHITSCLSSAREMSIMVTNQEEKMVKNLNLINGSSDVNKNYEETIKTLNTLQSNASVIEDSKQKKNYYKSLIIMDEMCRRAKINIYDLDKLKIIHVSGTKGKGSTCAFSESILRYHGYKTGFYSSPHIVEVRERIRINGKPLAKDLFCNYFWDCYNNLSSTKADHNDAMPAYFRFLTIMAFHTFLQEKVDVAIVEVGIGGHYDCTNIIKNPSICAVTSLGLDHTNVLGSTIEEIAWNKAGIFKEYIPALTVPQNADAFKVLQERSIERKAPLIQCVPDERLTHVQLGIPGFMQAYNASLAVKICEMWMEDESLSVEERRNKYEKIYIRQLQQQQQQQQIYGSVTQHQQHLQQQQHHQVLQEQQLYSNQQLQHQQQYNASKKNLLSNLFIKGLTNCNWPGRCQKVERGPVMYYLDGAHTEESIDVCAKWFLEEMDQGSKSKGMRDERHKRSVRILLFNSTGDRQPCNLLKGLLKCRFDYAVFCPNIQRPPTSSDKSASLKSDLTNRNVTRSAQFKRCLINMEAWLALNDNQSNCRKFNDLQTCKAEHEPPDLNLNNNLDRFFKVNGDINSSCDITARNDVTDGDMTSRVQFFPSIQESLNWIERFAETAISSAQSQKIFAENSPSSRILGHNGCDSSGDLATTDGCTTDNNFPRKNGFGCTDLPNGDDRTSENVVDDDEVVVRVLCAGSLHLVGGVLSLIDPDVCERTKE